MGGTLVPLSFPPAAGGVDGKDGMRWRVVLASAPESRDAWLCEAASAFHEGRGYFVTKGDNRICNNGFGVNSVLA